MMVAELRNVADKLALYTDDNRVYERFHKRTPTLYRVPYIQNGKLVAIDLYFDRKLKNTITQVINGQLMLEM